MPGVRTGNKLVGYNRRYYETVGRLRDRLTRGGLKVVDAVVMEIGGIDAMPKNRRHVEDRLGMLEETMDQIGEQESYPSVSGFGIRGKPDDIHGMLLEAWDCWDQGHLKS